MKQKRIVTQTFVDAEAKIFTILHTTEKVYQSMLKEIEIIRQCV